MNKSVKSKSGRLFVVAAPTGGGKSTLVTRALAKLNSLVTRIVTYTTRPPRPGEIDGQDYIFVNRDAFTKLQAENHFAEVTTYNDNLYGSPRAFLDRLPNGESFVAITDRAGLKFYKQLCDTAVCIWISPPSLEVLQTRLANRRSETPGSLMRRLALAAQEMAQEKSSPLCHYHIINDELDRATEELIKIMSGELLG